MQAATASHGDMVLEMRREAGERALLGYKGARRTVQDATLPTSPQVH